MRYLWNENTDADTQSLSHTEMWSRVLIYSEGGCCHLWRNINEKHQIPRKELEIEMDGQRMQYLEEARYLGCSGS